MTEKPKLPLDNIEVMDDDLMFVLGGAGNDQPGSDAGCGCGSGCGCSCKTGSGCGCECSSGGGCGCNCVNGQGCGCGCQKPPTPPPTFP